MVAEHRDDYFAALLDMELPDAPHGEVVDFIVSQGIPSIVFTGKFDNQIRNEILNKGAVDYVLKNNINCVDEIVALVSRLHQNQFIKIMVVDDSKTSREHIKNALLKYKFKVLDLSEGGTALNLLREESGIKLVITDFAMPNMNGFEITERIRRQYAKGELAIIGISAQEESSLSVQFLKHGADDFLGKPFEREELYCRVLHNIETIERIKSLRELNELKNKFLGIAAHDLRSPINGIKGFTDMLLEEMAGPLNQEQKEFLKMVDESSKNMLVLINDLLDLTSIEQGRLKINRERRNLTELVRQRVHLFRYTAEKKGIKISLTADDILEMLIDAQRFSQMLDNLLSNAVKFTPENKEIKVSLKQEGSEAVIRVQDQGPGISLEEQKKLFTEFYKGEARPTAGEGSTGLGLAIVKKIVNSHRGRVKVESFPGQGAEFVVRLPIE